MEKKEPILHGNYYHIYNRGNNGIDVFLQNENYYHFLNLYAKYIEPIAETYAWCLLKNHFHLLVRIKEKSEINKDELSYSTIEKPKVIDPSRQFSHLFNAYTQAINKRHNRTGSLFETTFERKIVTSERYFQQLIFYIHNNPVHHGFVEKPDDWLFSSYGLIPNQKSSKLKKQEVLNWFGGIDNYQSFHLTDQNLESINDLIFE